MLVTDSDLSDRADLAEADNWFVRTVGHRPFTTRVADAPATWGTHAFDAVGRRLRASDMMEPWLAVGDPHFRSI